MLVISRLLLIKLHPLYSIILNVNILINCNGFKVKRIWNGPMAKRHRSSYKQSCTLIKELSEEEFSFDEVKLACEKETGCNLLSQKQSGGDRAYKLRECPCPIPTPEIIPNNPETAYYIDC